MCLHAQVGACLHVGFSFCVSVHIYTHVYKQAFSSSAVCCIGKSMPSGWLVCAKSNMSPKHAAAKWQILNHNQAGPSGSCSGLCFSTLRLYILFSGLGNILTVS